MAIKRIIKKRILRKKKSHKKKNNRKNKEHNPFAEEFKNETTKLQRTNKWYNMDNKKFQKYASIRKSSRKRRSIFDIHHKLIPHGHIKHVHEVF